MDVTVVDRDRAAKKLERHPRWEERRVVARSEPVNGKEDAADRAVSNAVDRAIWMVAAALDLFFTAPNSLAMRARLTGRCGP